MAPPNFTPSPHGFLTQPRAPPSFLRTVQRSTATTTSSSQFAPTPRFSLSCTQTGQPDDAIHPSSSPSASTSPLVSRPRPRVRLRRGEEIEDSDQEEEKGGRTRQERERASRDLDGEIRSDDEDEPRRARRHKRRRLSIHSGGREEYEFIHGGQSVTERQREVIAISSSPPSSRSPSPPLSPCNTAKLQQSPLDSALSLSLPTTTTTAPTPPHPPHHPTPRFLLPLPTSSFSFPPTIATPHPATTTSPTLFLLPPAQPPSPTSHDPLPDLFSPHRRGQKFLPDGLAATVRDWVVEVGSRGRNHSQNQRGARGRGQRGSRDVAGSGGNGEEEGGGVRMRVLDVWSDGNVVLVRGTMGVGDGEEGGRKWMLMGAGGRGREVRAGVVVVVRAPVWEVEVKGERWGVGVEWRVAGGG